MVSTAPEVLMHEAEQLFREQEVPANLAFFEDLSPLHQRLFVVDLWEALSKTAGRQPSAAELKDLVILIEGWEATSELDQAPEIVAEMRRPKEYRTLRSFMNE